MDSETAPTRTPLARTILKDLSIMVVVGAVLAVIGPFGSIEDPLAMRLIVWIGFAVVGYALYRPIDALSLRLAPVLGMPRWWLSIVACLIATVPMATLVWVIGFAGREIVWPSPPDALVHYLNVLVVGAGITALFYVIGSKKEEVVAPVADTSDAPSPSPPASEPDPVTAPDQPRLLDRLPPALGSDIRALEMEDHYVRVHTALGSEMILLRLRDAVAECDGIEGMQVHRSWWVARAAVDDVIREGRNVRLKLGDNLEAPVSRANVSVLRDAGWI